MSNPVVEGPRPGSTLKRSRPLLIVGIIALLVLMAGGLAYYWFDWATAREDWRALGQDNEALSNAGSVFLGHIEAGRLDDAYQSTTGSFQKQVSRQAFEKRVLTYMDFKRKQGSRHVIYHQRGGQNQMSKEAIWEDVNGNRLQLLTNVIIEDSIFHHRPPPPSVGEFTVTELGPGVPVDPLGRKKPLKN